MCEEVGERMVMSVLGWCEVDGVEGGGGLVDWWIDR